MFFFMFFTDLITYVNKTYYERTNVTNKGINKFENLCQRGDFALKLRSPCFKSRIGQIRFTIFIKR